MLNFTFNNLDRVSRVMNVPPKSSAKIPELNISIMMLLEGLLPDIILCRSRPSTFHSTCFMLDYILLTRTPFEAEGVALVSASAHLSSQLLSG